VYLPHLSDVTKSLVDTSEMSYTPRVVRLLSEPGSTQGVRPITLRTRRCKKLEPVDERSGGQEPVPLTASASDTFRPHAIELRMGDELGRIVFQLSERGC